MYADMLYFWCKNLALNIRIFVCLLWGVVVQRLERRFKTCASSFTPHCLCISDKTLQAVGPFYMVAMAGEVKLPIQPYMGWMCQMS